MSIKRLPLSELRLGMYIHKLDGDWFRHPFWRGRFLLTRWQDLEKIRTAGIRFVWIDTAKGRPMDGAPERTDPEDPGCPEDPEAPVAWTEISFDGAAEARRSAARHHHEKYDGSGYPDRLRGRGIPLLARMGAVCDIYDAVTSERVYKAPWNPAEAMRRMAGWKGHFDRPVFEAFVKTVGIYPIGSLVRLESRRLAVVVAPGADSLLTPRVEAFFSLDAGGPCPCERLDLGDPDCDDRILGPEDPSAWNLAGLDARWMGAGPVP